MLYVGRPRDSVVVEAYRHLVDAVEGMRADLVQPRILLTVEVRVDRILNLTDVVTRELVGLTAADLGSAIGDYERCCEVGAAAFELGLKGVLAPAATGLGETLALYDEHLDAGEIPRIVRQETWDGLPPDPRRLRLVTDTEGA